MKVNVTSDLVRNVLAWSCREGIASERVGRGSRNVRVGVWFVVKVNTTCDLVRSVKD